MLNQNQKNVISSGETAIFLNWIKEINTLPSICERHYFLAQLILCCPSVYLKIFPEQDLLETLLQHHIEAYIFAADNEKYKKHAFKFLQKAVRECAFSSTLPLKNDYKEVLVEIFKEQQSREKKSKTSSHSNFFKQAATIACAAGGFYLTGGLGLLGGAATGYFAANTLETCTRKSR